MTAPSLTQERLKELLHYDAETGIFTWCKTRGPWAIQGERAGTLNKGHLYIAINGKKYATHRLAWFYMLNKWPDYQLDHIDRNRTNNKFTNLREAPGSMNHHNQGCAQKHNKLGILGVNWHRATKKYYAKIQVNGKQISLGYYNTPEEAHQAYIKAKRKLHEGCTI